MIVEDVEAVVVAAGARRWVFVELRTRDGVVGVGEGSQSRCDSGVVAHVERLAPKLRGRRVLDVVNPMVASLEANQFAARDLNAATSAVEQALWDAAGKHLGLPCWRLLGGRVRDRVRAYANLALATASDHPDAWAEAAARAVAAGFTAVKVYPLGNFAGVDAEAGLDRRLSAGELEVAVERLRAVRVAVGSDIDVLVDCSWTLGDADAVRIARRWADLAPYWLEEPFAFTDPARLRELRRRTGLRIAAGELSLRREAFRHLLEQRAVDVVMPDVKWLGGIAAARGVALAAETWGVEVSPHNMSGPVATAASAVVAGTCRAADLLELPFGAGDVADRLTGGQGVRVEDGYVVLDERPGLGVGWDPAAARHLATDPTA